MLAGIDYDGRIIVGTEKNDYINRPCTVVVHDGDKHERVFTETEVRAMFVDVAHFVGNTNLIWNGIYRIAKKHGFSLDTPNGKCFAKGWYLKSLRQHLFKC